MQKIETTDITEDVVNVNHSGVKYVDLSQVEDVDALEPADIYNIPYKKYLEKKNFNRDKYKMCEICIAEQKRKYNGRTPIECTGLKDFNNIIDTRYSEEERDDLLESLRHLSEDELETIRGQFSPTDWFKTNTNDPETYKERWYQTLITSCSAKKRVLRMGRRCIEESQKVLMKDGSRKKIKDVVVGDVIVSSDNHKKSFNKVKEVIDNGIKPLYEIQTVRGNKVRVSSDHPFLTEYGWASIETGLRAGIKISCLPKFKEDSFEYIEIASIKTLEEFGRVYDLTVEDNPNFVVNGILAHNCGKTFSAAMYVLHRIATTDRKINVLVVAPMQTHLNEIVNTLKNLCDVLKYDIWDNKKSTPIIEITFFNGSTVQCIVGANDGTSARGKRADILWIDETDFVGTRVLDSLKAIEMDNPNVETIYTSTPLGEGNLYRFAESEQVKEFHYPSYVIPHYTEQMHQSNKQDLDEVVFAQEILALFGVDVHGVFPVRFIDRAESFNIPHMFNESYVLNNRDKFIIIIGVDWNHDNNGTRIVVVGYSKEIERFFIIEKDKISKLNYTQALSVEKVVELNRKYEADHVACDQGFGAGQIADLRMKGRSQYGKVPVNHPDLRLTKLEAVDFGSVVELRDPVSREVLKKGVKQFIVENTVHYFEESRIALDEIEDYELILQLKNYAIVNRTQRGNVYKAKDKKIGDHDLDAFIIALYMFEKQYGKLLSVGNINNEMPAYMGKQQVTAPPSSRTSLDTQTPSINQVGSIRPRKGFKSRKKW